MAKNKKDNQPGQKKTDKTGAEGQNRAENKKNEPSVESKKRGNELDF